MQFIKTSHPERSRDCLFAQKSTLFNYPRKKRTRKGVVSSLGIRSNRESERTNVGYFNKMRVRVVASCWRGEAERLDFAKIKCSNRITSEREKNCETKNPKM